MTDAGTVFITGAGGGIGAAVARTVAAHGHPVEIMDLDLAGAGGIEMD